MPEFKPQPGFQEAFLSSTADIVFGGGAAGAGKTFALLLDPLRNRYNPRYSATIFRRTRPQIRVAGGMWDESRELYPYAAGTSFETQLKWRFPSGATINFSHMEYEKTKFEYMGSQIPFIGFDQLEHFSSSMFFYMLSRNRSTCGVTPCIRATCNPDPDSWIAEFIDWYIGEDGYAIPERAGVVRFFLRFGDNFFWGDTKKELRERFPEILEEGIKAGINPDNFIKSFTFIPGDIYGNKILLSENPEYLGNLLAQDEATKMQLLRGNWKISVDGLALMDYQRVNELFTNFPEKSDENEKYIIIDPAGWGKDLAVAGVWEGLECNEIHIWTKCGQDELYRWTEETRERENISQGNVGVDYTGIGAGLTEIGEYEAFQAEATVIIPTEAENDPMKKPRFATPQLKTQCYYKLSEVLNFNLMRIHTKFFVDGKEQSFFMRGSKRVEIIPEIKRQLRAIKRRKAEAEGAKKVNTKEEQKAILGCSPDFADMLMMRMMFVLRPTMEGFAWMG